MRLTNLCKYDILCMFVNNLETANVSVSLPTVRTGTSRYSYKDRKRFLQPSDPKRAIHEEKELSNVLSLTTLAHRTRSWNKVLQLRVSIHDLKNTCSSEISDLFSDIRFYSLASNWLRRVYSRPRDHSRCLFCPVRAMQGKSNHQEKERIVSPIVTATPKFTTEGWFF